MKTILIVTGDYPYPPRQGGRIDAWNRIKTLKHLGYLVNLIITTKNIQENSKYNEYIYKYADSIHIVYRKNRIRDLFSRKPLQVVSRKGLRDVKFYKEYDFVILEGDHVGAILDNTTLKCKHIILRSHNNETVYFKNLLNSTSDVIKKIYYYTEYKKFAQYEPWLIQKINNIMFISHDEKSNYDRIFPDINSVFLPANVNMQFRKQELSNNTVVFISSLYMTNNKEGLIWYIKNIHPRVSEKVSGYQLIVAGNSNGNSLRWLYKLIEHMDNVKVIDTPEYLDDIYASGSVFINPMLHGAGVKLKTIEAIVNGLPVVSTTIGNEGTGLRHEKEILVTDDVNQYSEFVIDLLSEKEGIKQRIVKSAQDFIKQYYDTEKILSNFLESLQ